MNLQELRELRFLSVADNQLTGNLPDFFGELKYLQELQIDSNNFSGPIPALWCTEDFNISKVLVQDNLDLCGMLFRCGIDCFCLCSQCSVVHYCL